MKKFLNFLLNFFWILLIGLVGSISCILGGVLLCVTLIGIPAGIVTFKLIPLVFAPFGKSVVLNFDKHPVLNVLWFIFIGLGCFISYLVLGAVLCVSLIGIPLGLQIFKISKYFIAPFGAKIVKTEDFKTTDELAEQVDANNGFTFKAFKDLPKKVKANPNMVVNGKPAKDFIQDRQPTLQVEKSLNSLIAKYKFSLGFGIVISLILLIASAFFGLFYGYLLFKANLETMDLSFLESLQIDVNYYIEFIDSFPFVTTLTNLDIFYLSYFTYILYGAIALSIIILISCIAYNTKHLAKTKKSKLALFNSNYSDLVAAYLNAPKQKTKKKKTLTHSLLYAVK